MRKIFWQNMVTLDGFAAGPNGEIDWHVVDAEFGDYAQRMLATIDGFIFGRRTYEGMASYWSTSKDAVAAPMNVLKKYVASRTLEEVTWNNSELLRGDVVTAVKSLKSQPGRELAIFGSSELVGTLLPAGVIDEVHLFVCPLILGGGEPSFRSLSSRMPMSLLSSRTFASGVVFLRYGS